MGLSSSDYQRMDAITSVSAVAPAGKSDSNGGRNAPPATPVAAAAATAPDGKGGSDAVPSEQLKAAAARAMAQLDQSNQELTFVFDDKLGRMLVKIVDKQTNTVVRQVPSEDMLVMARALADSPSRGVLVKSRA